MPVSSTISWKWIQKQTWRDVEDLFRKIEKGEIQLQMRHLHIGMAMQVSLYELGVLPLYHRQPRQHRWRHRLGYPSQSPRHLQLNIFLDYPQLAVCTTYFNWLEETPSDYTACWYRKGLLLPWSSECCCFAPGLGKAVSGVGALPRMVRLHAALSCSAERHKIGVNLNWITALTVWGAYQYTLVDEISYFKEGGRRERAPGVAQIQEVAVFS